MKFDKLTFYNASRKPFSFDIPFTGDWSNVIFGCRKKEHCIEFGEDFYGRHFYINQLEIQNVKIFNPNRQKNKMLEWFGEGFDFQSKINWAFLESKPSKDEPQRYTKLISLGFDGHFAKEDYETLMIYDKSKCKLINTEKNKPYKSMYHKLKELGLYD